MRASAALIFVALLGASPAVAQDKPAAKDSAAIEQCVKAKTGRHWDWEKCIGLISEPCSKNEGAMKPQEVTACADRERAVWDDMLNASFRLLTAKLDEGQVSKLRDMQRAWMTSRDKTCGFIYDYFEGSMASPMIAHCLSRATGMQALFLRGFADDVAERK
ncbi:MAG TPA: lysozyme inhibitor LprI family protein [Pseudolabrys sp.]|jgi:uncharacterized protein YecT (DUF1311 family)